MSSQQLNKHNAAYLRNIAELIESGVYEMHGTGGCDFNGLDITVKIDAVFKPIPEGNFNNVVDPA